MSTKNTFRVLSYNIHKGFNQLNRKYIADEIRHSVRLINADIRFLQEVIGRNDKHSVAYHEWDDDSQLEYLADSVWHHYAYGKNAIYEHGHHGNAILSKVPFRQWENIDISYVRKSHRGILFGQLDNGVQLMCTHFGLLSKEQKQQSQRLQQEIKLRMYTEQPFILAGAFNDFSMKTHNRLLKRFDLQECCECKNSKLASTFPSRYPLFALDRIYFSGL